MDSFLFSKHGKRFMALPARLKMAMKTPGTYSYSPEAETALPVGTNTLTATSP